jgi:transcriptional regulator with PAS, ATPase and Fis domain
MINCEKIIDSIHVGILTIDAELNIYYVNKWFAVHSDIDDADSCIGKNLLSLFDLSSERQTDRQRSERLQCTDELNMSEIEKLKKEIEDLKLIIESKNNQVESKNKHIKRLERIISNMKKEQSNRA